MQSFRRRIWRSLSHGLLSMLLQSGSLLLKPKFSRSRSKRHSCLPPLVSTSCPTGSSRGFFFWPILLGSQRLLLWHVRRMGMCDIVGIEIIELRNHLQKCPNFWCSAQSICTPRYQICEALAILRVPNLVQHININRDSDQLAASSPRTFYNQERRGRENKAYESCGLFCS